MDRITNPKDSNVCKTTGNNDNTTPTGSDILGLNLCYKHAIPAELVYNSAQNLCYKHIIPTEFNFGNPNSCNTNKIRNPEDSNVYRTMGGKDNPTPTGSYIPIPRFGYKHAIPSEFNFGNPELFYTDKTTNPEDSNVCRTTGNKNNSTPTGSYILGLNLCYKHAIPSELVDNPGSCLCYKHEIPKEFNFENPNFGYTNKTTNPEDSNVYKTTCNNDNSTPSGSYIPRPCFGYKHVIPSELVDNSVQNLCYKHIIPSEFSFGNPKFYLTDRITNPEDSNIYRTMRNNDNTTPSGSHNPVSCFGYKHTIPSELVNNKHK